MKKNILGLLLVCLTLGVIAQQEKLTITKVKKGQEPKEVMTAIAKDFPIAVSKDLSFLPAQLYGKEWNVKLEGSQLDLDYYQVNIKQGNKDYVAVYDKSGKMLSSEQINRDVQLPVEIIEALKTFGAGWHIDKTHEVIKYNGKEISDVYKVKLQKGAEHKIVFLDAKGNIISSHFTLI